MITFESDATSLHTWAKEFTAWHDLKKPFAPENGEALKFKVGDRVIYTNENGVTFHRRITEFYRPDSTTTSYARGGRYSLDSDSPWVPVTESSLRLLDEDNADTAADT